MRRRQQQRHMTASETNQNPRDTPRRVPVRWAPGFVYLSGYPSWIPSDKPTKDPTQVTIVKPPSMPSETPTKYHSRGPKSLPSSNPRNIPNEPLSGDPTGSTSTIPTYKPSSNSSARTSSDSDALKRGSQEATVSLQINIVLSLIHIILSLSSNQKSTRTHQRGSLIISDK